MSEAKGPLEERVKKPKLPLTVTRRLNALGKLPPGLTRSIPEECDMSIIIYERLREKIHNVAYANPAAISAFGCGFEEITQFNTATLDTGEKEETQLDKTLISCAREGWDKLNDLVLRIPTEDKKILRIAPYLRHQKEYGHDYWTAYIPKDGVRKIDPNSWRYKTISFFERIHKAFKGDRIYMQAPEYVGKEFVDVAAKKIVSRKYNIVIDFKKTQSMGAGVLKVLTGMSEMFHDQLFLVNTGDSLYQLLTHHRVSKENIYRAKNPQISFT